MILQMHRHTFTENATFSDILDSKGQRICYILEDTDRRLETGGTKLYGRTAIPRGKYQVIVDFSPRFNRELPRLLNVKDFSGVRIHTGNRPEDTEGCLIPGLKMQPEKEWVTNSIAAFNALLKVIKSADECWIEIT